MTRPPVGASDEHNRLSVGGAAYVALGDRLRLIEPCDPTINLHDWYVGVRGDVVETVWPVAAERGVLKRWGWWRCRKKALTRRNRN